MHLQANVIEEYVQDQILPDVVNFCFIRKVPTKAWIQCIQLGMKSESSPDTQNIGEWN